MKTHSIFAHIDNQRGSLMVIALLIMTSLAVAGLLVTNDAIMESRVGRNYAIHKQTEAAAEAAGKEAMQAIQSIILDPAQDTAADVVKALNSETWQPYNGFSATFNFNEDLLRNGTYRIKTSVLEGDPPIITDADAMAVVVDQPATIAGSLGGTKVPGFFKYDVYCRAVHAGAGNSEAILMIGFQQKHI